MGLYDNLQASVEEIIAEYKQRTTDNQMSFGDAMTLTFNATATFVRLVEGVQSTGNDKKDVVLVAIGRFYDAVIRPIPLTGMPGPIEGLVDTALKGLILAIAGAGIDATVNIFNKLGWSATPEAVAAAQLMEPIIF